MFPINHKKNDFFYYFDVTLGGPALRISVKISRNTPKLSRLRRALYKILMTFDNCAPQARKYLAFFSSKTPRKRHFIRFSIRNDVKFVKISLRGQDLRRCLSPPLFENRVKQGGNLRISAKISRKYPKIFAPAARFIQDFDDF